MLPIKPERLQNKEPQTIPYPYELTHPHQKQVFMCSGMEETIPNLNATFQVLIFEICYAESCRIRVFNETKVKH